MSEVDPSLRDKFESLPIELKNEILSRDVHLKSMADLVQVLEQIQSGE